MVWLERTSVDDTESSRMIKTNLEVRCRNFGESSELLVAPRNCRKDEFQLFPSPSFCTPEGSRCIAQSKESSVPCPLAIVLKEDL